MERKQQYSGVEVLLGALLGFYQLRRTHDFFPEFIIYDRRRLFEHSSENYRCVVVRLVKCRIQVRGIRSTGCPRWFQILPCDRVFKAKGLILIKKPCFSRDSMSKLLGK
ncbi:hypothetical protein DMR_18730 [Solidesulfovibrio magneticus RS-1]|uniref:Uncharacterized protein n=1 Tax=Solidesulfovibrio magneticus (strain ATCC 700980 / DSM 13731 / RS-1) TaxID=573370 RepID=C4XQJ9_SOLM1|nr:hypothetical protein DMR_18730 [Solidesulfovibrio magneticus RS-1]